MPTPKPNESKDDYMSRCIPKLVAEGKDQDQAIAICSSMFESDKRKDSDEDERQKPMDDSIRGRKKPKKGK